MQNYKFILIIVLAVTFPNIPQAKMYKWVDQNGKVTYSNVAPPSSAQKVKTFKETTEAPMDRAIRIENDRIQSEEAAALKEYQQEQKRILREEQKRLLREEKKRTAIENAQKRQRQKDIVSAENNKMKSAYELELTRLQMKQKSAEKRCREIGTKRCLPATRKRYERKINALNSDPQQYLYNKKVRNIPSRPLSYTDGENDAWIGLPQKSNSGPYNEGYQDEEDREQW